jgi:hypothetical protein
MIPSPPVLLQLKIGISIFAAAKKLTVPPIYEAHKHPANIAVAFASWNLIKKNETQQPRMEPILPAANGIAIPSIELLLFFVALLDDCDEPLHVNFSLAEGVERSAKTSDDGRKILQHRLYSKWSVGIFRDVFERKAADSNVTTWPPLKFNLSDRIPIIEESTSVAPAAKSPVATDNEVTTALLCDDRGIIWFSSQRDLRGIRCSG